MKTKIYKLYRDLSKKYGKGDAFWKKWRKKNKTNGDKEEIILGAILTQRTNWKNVELALKNLRNAKALSIGGVYRLGRKDIKRLQNLIRPSGFYKQKAERIFNLCRFIIKNHKNLKGFFSQGLGPCREQLLGLCGIGPETADSILLYAGRKPIFVIDEYTRRFAKKRGLCRKFSYDWLQRLFQENLPRDVNLYQNFHAMIVLDGK